MHFEVDGYSYQIDKRGITVLQACLEVGITIPRFCFHEKLTIAGNCRMCLVEVSANPRSKKPIASCALPLGNNMVIYTNTVLVRKARESVLEFLLANHPLDCPICDQGGECDLQDQSFFFGNDKSRFYENKRVVADKFCGPFIKTVMTRCIHCTRCVRFATELAGVDFFGVTGRGSSMEIGTYIEKIFNSELSGNIIDLCPVGALTSKTYAFVARPWELRSVESLDIFDTFGSRIRIDSRGLEILRILPSFNKFVNEEWINDRIRFSYDGLQRQRLVVPLIRNVENLLFTETSWSFVFLIIFENLFFKINFQNYFFPIHFILGKTIDLNMLYILKKFFNFYFVKNSIIFVQNFLTNLKLDNLNLLFINYQSLETKNRDGFIFFFLNPRLEIPLLNLKIRKNYLSNQNFFFATFGYVTYLNYPSFQIGNTIKDLFNFFKGKNLISKKLIQLKNPLFLVGENFSKLNLISLNFFLQNVQLIMSFLMTVKKYSFFYNVKILYTKTGLLNFAAFDFINSKIISMVKKTNFIFLINTDKYMTYSNIKNSFKNYYVYIGSHGNSDAEFSDIILPATTFVESALYYLNLENNIQSTQYIITPPINSREVWRILYNIFLYFLRILLLILKNKINFYKFHFFNYEISLFNNNLLQYILKSTNFLNKNQTFLDLLRLFFNSYNLSFNFAINIISTNNIYYNKDCLLNRVFVNNLESFYKGNIITKNSKFMNLGYLEFELNELNF